MEFEWDENKNLINILKHKIDFRYAITIFRKRRKEFEDLRKDYGEKRIITYGESEDQLRICLVYTIRSGRIRIISARKASEYERRKYY